MFLPPGEAPEQPFVVAGRFDHHALSCPPTILLKQPWLVPRPA
jgi:hypothetical protein